MRSGVVGPALEARIQRIFLAQGILAERGLRVIADRTGEKIATDIDILTSEYASGFHVTRRHAECKGGTKFHPLDRVLWMRGVRHLLSADSSYFIVETIDPEIASFARRMQVELWTVHHLNQWETALGIREKGWPCRSDYASYSAARIGWMRRVGKLDSNNRLRRTFFSLLRFVEDTSWLMPSYNNLNRLSRYIEDVGRLHKAGELRNGEEAEPIRYLISALLVRLSQYLIFVCFDVSTLQRSAIREYLSSRLVFGDQDVKYSKGLVEGVLKLTRVTLESQGITPLTLDPGRLMMPPSWSEHFVALILRLLDSPNEARYLPIAMEATQFDIKESVKQYPRLLGAVSVGADLAALVKGFLVQAMALPQELLEPLPATRLTLSSAGEKLEVQLELRTSEAAPPAVSGPRPRKGK